MTSQCEQRTTQKRFMCRTLTVQQAVVPQWTLQAQRLPKLKMTELAGEPLNWPEWSSPFNAVIHNAPIDDNAKRIHLKTLIKGKAKAAIAVLIN